MVHTTTGSIVVSGCCGEIPYGGVMDEVVRRYSPEVAATDTFSLTHLAESKGQVGRLLNYMGPTFYA
eukprot:gene5910-5809_t